MDESGSETNGTIRPVGIGEAAQILAIVNEAAEAYRGHIPDDCWHAPYMDAAELHSELAAGVRFRGYEVEGELVAVMGVQPMGRVTLIRHAYVLPAWQGRGLGSRLLDHLCGTVGGQWLIGTWRAAQWAIDFYEGHGFRRVPDEAVPGLLRAFWRIGDRQIETSVVLARPALDAAGYERLADARPAAADPDQRKASA